MTGEDGLTRYRNVFTGELMVSDGEESMTYREYLRNLRHSEDYRWHMADEVYDREKDERGGDGPMGMYP